MIWHHSSYSVDNGTCVEVAFRSRCDTGQCVEVGITPAQVFVRDSKNPGPVLTFSPDVWQGFVDGVKDKEFDMGDG